MGAIGGLLGLSGGAGGSGFNPQSGTNQGQLDTALQTAQGGIGQQQALLQALQGQNGIQNQNQIYGQLQGVVNGTGPNPAQAQLAQATGANVANQAALMAGQRGAGANVGLLARQAAQQGAGIQQNAAGQAATLQANQSLNALGQAGQLAGNQVSNQIGATQGLNQAAQGEQGILQAANSANNTNQTALANTTMQGQQSLIGGGGQAAGSALSLLAAQGGTIPMADGGSMGPSSYLGQILQGYQGGGSDSGAKDLQKGSAALGTGIGTAIKGKGSTPIADSLTMPQIGSQFETTAPSLGASIGQAPAPMTGPSLGNYTFKEGGNVGSKLKSGGGVPGKAPVQGNSYANDNVKALLSPGEGVIDRETMADQSPVGQAARFVMAYVNHKKGKK